MALPPATQNGINEIDAANLVKNGCFCVSEGANMLTTPAGKNVFLEAGTRYGPSTAANAGGVATSGLTMLQNALRMSWSREEVDQRLHNIMINIHESCRRTAEEYGQAGNYVPGANIAGFLTVANAMMDQGLVQCGSGARGRRVATVPTRIDAVRWRRAGAAGRDGRGPLRPDAPAWPYQPRRRGERAERPSGRRASGRERRTPATRCKRRGGLRRDVAGGGAQPPTGTEPPSKPTR